MSKQWLMILTTYILFNLLICFLVRIFVEEYLLFLSFANILFYFIIHKNRISKDRAKFISVIMTIIACWIGRVVYNDIHRINLKNNNYSMLGLVNNVKKGGRSAVSYYIIRIKYLTQVDNYTIKYVEIEWNTYETRIQSKIGDTVFLRKDFNKNNCKVISWHPSRDTLELFQKPIKYVDGEEIGNDYYYYAKLRPTIALKNFGLNVVFKSLCRNDTILFYKNLNSNIDSVAHRLADTLQTQVNRNIVGDEYGFLFHEGIYTKEQVFEEIQQAKEYYLKYCKDEDTSSVNILRNH